MADLTQSRDQYLKELQESRAQLEARAGEWEEADQSSALASPCKRARLMSPTQLHPLHSLDSGVLDDDDDTKCHEGDNWRCANKLPCAFQTQDAHAANIIR